MSTGAAARATPEPGSPLLSVVLAATGRSSAADALAALTRSCAAVRSEIILADGTRGAAATIAARDFPGVAVVRCPERALVPCLWATGYRMARGEIVAFTIAECVVDDGWASAAAESLGLAGGDAGVGGAITAAPALGAGAWAMWALRYSGFLPEPAARRPVRDVAGDNAAYRRAVLARHESTFADGFWEVDLHRQIRSEGEVLALVPGMTARFVGGATLGAFALQRFRHGRHAGHWRVATGARRWWEVCLASPAVPLALTLRVCRSLRRAGMRLRADGVAAVLLLAGTWSAGEVVGAVAGPSGGCSPGARRAWRARNSTVEQAPVPGP